MADETMTVAQVPPVEPTQAPQVATPPVIQVPALKPSVIEASVVTAPLVSAPAPVATAPAPLPTQVPVVVTPPVTAPVAVAPPAPVATVVPPLSSTGPTFLGTVWSQLKTVLHWLALKFGAPVVVLLLVVVGIFLASIGVKDLQIGGIIGKLLGKKSDNKATDVVNTIPPDRVDTNGNLIPQGTPDSKGDVQAVVVPIQDTGGLLSDPSTVKVTPPGSDKPINVQLPDGVKSSDVDKVIIVSPTKIVVSVKDTSGIQAQTIDNLLTKYGG